MHFNLTEVSGEHAQGLQHLGSQHLVYKTSVDADVSAAVPDRV